MLLYQPFFLYASRRNQSFKDDGVPFDFSDEDWERLNKVIGYKEGDDGQSSVTNERADALHTSLEIFVKHNASKLMNESKEYLAELSCEGLGCSVKLYPETKVFDVKLGSYKLSSPNGLLAQVKPFHCLDNLLLKVWLNRC